MTKEWTLIRYKVNVKGRKERKGRRRKGEREKRGERKNKRMKAHKSAPVLVKLQALGNLAEYF